MVAHQEAPEPVLEAPEPVLAPKVLGRVAAGVDAAIAAFARSA